MDLVKRLRLILCLSLSDFTSVSFCCSPLSLPKKESNSLSIRQSLRARVGSGVGSGSAASVGRFNRYFTFNFISVHSASTIAFWNISCLLTLFSASATNQYPCSWTLSLSELSDLSHLTGSSLSTRVRPEVRIYKCNVVCGPRVKNATKVYPDVDERGEE